MSIPTEFQPVTLVFRSLHSAGKGEMVTNYQNINWTGIHLSNCPVENLQDMIRSSDFLPRR